MLLQLARNNKKVACFLLTILYLNTVLANVNTGQEDAYYHINYERHPSVFSDISYSGSAINKGVANNVADSIDAALQANPGRPADDNKDDQQETTGPSQPEMKSFESVNTNNMVDLFTGDFSYNIPLLDVGGYPVNIHYSSGISMDQEASWVGLGWNINPGTINRSLRGTPDDFDGKNDVIERTQHIKENKTTGVSIQESVEVFGNPRMIPRVDLSATFGIFKNTYNGYGIETGVGIGGTGKTAFGSLTGNLSISNNSQTGLTINPSLSVKLGKADAENNARTSLGLSTGYYSRGGITSLQFNGGVQSDAKKYQEINQYAGANNSFPLSTISFATPAYTPTISMPMTNTSFSFTGKFGGEASGVDVSTAFTGYVNSQKIADEDTTQRIPAIGYLYSTNGNGREDVLMDFNREKELEFNYKTTPHIAIPQYTYDAFSISGEGTGGSFRAYRGDVGYVFDHSIATRSSSTNGSIDAGVGGYAHGGLEITNVTTSNENHRWNRSNLAEPFMNFKPADTTYEAVYFRNPGEKTINSKNYYRTIGDDSLVRLKLTGSGDAVQAANSFIKYSNGKKSGEIPFTQSLSKSQRDKRTQVITYLTAKDARSFGLEKDIKSYAENSQPTGACATTVTSISRVDNNTHKENHLSEISVLNSDGRKYVYGIPVYNIKQEDVTFSVDTKKNPDILTNGLTEYNLGENSTQNRNGKDGYFSKEVIPAYAHSFLLSGILSPDYVDITGDGISEDDPGDAIKFNYTEVYNATNPYTWRTPLSTSSPKLFANYNEGLKTYNRDDKGTYVYGEKELWYLNSIESKTMVAVFTMANDRKDAYSVQDENGFPDKTKSGRRLDRIDLYAKADLLKNGSLAKPIKTVHFSYSYDLCKGSMGDNTVGKLTLNSIWFTYNNNNKGQLNPYVFKYHPDANGQTNALYNPSYSTTMTDRWGSFKNSSSNPGGLKNVDFPYAVQDSATASQYASAWHLTDIKLPSGGNMRVTYESDDYAYVQNKRAVQMFTIAGIDHPNGINLYNPLTYNDFFKIYINTTDIVQSKADIKNKYLGIDSVLYFKFAVTMPTDRWGGGTEMVPGYATIQDYGLSVNNNKQFWITVAPIENRSPFSRAALQFLRLNLPSKAYPTSETGDNLKLADAVKMLVSGFPELRNSLEGFDNVAKGKQLCNKVVLNQSFVRLSSPNYKKMGGGQRVKKIELFDNWKSMTRQAQKESVYGQEYIYTTTENVDGKKVLISSGVATYEPTIGGEENAWRRPINYIEKLAPLAPSSFLFSEEPVGESYFPAPMVGYSRVNVRTINTKSISANGWEESEYYTSKDFPTIVEHTLLESGDSKTKYETKSSILRLNHKNHVTLSQGFRIELNDMNGKLKAQSSYAENDPVHPIKYTLNFYRTDNDKAYQKHLNNQVWVVDSASGHIDTAGQIGKDIEIMADFREQHSLAKTKGFSPNVDVIPIFGFPVPIPSFYNFPQSEDVRFRSAAIVKIVQRYGILDSVVAMDKGSVVSTKNVLYDAETGNVVLSRTNNEFNDPVYNFNYPAYWAYSGMGLAYQNVNAVLKQKLKLGYALINGRLYKEGDTTIYPSARMFESGDEVFVDTAYTGLTGIDCRHINNSGTFWSGKLWAIEAAKGQGNDSGLYFIDEAGKVPPSLLIQSMRIMRSGKRNMPDVSAGNIVMLANPMILTGGQYRISIDSNTQVLNASVATYKDLWKVENVLYQADSTYRLFKTNQDTLLSPVPLYNSYNTSAIFRNIRRRVRSHFDNDLTTTNTLQSNFVASSRIKHDDGSGNKDYEYILKSVVKFDFSGIPTSAVVNSTLLSLPGGAPANAWDGGNTGHPDGYKVQDEFRAKTTAHALSGESKWLNGRTNESYIKKVSGPWNINSTSFNNLLTQTIPGIGTLSQAPDQSCDNRSIGLNSVVQSFIANPGINQGFSIELKDYTTGSTHTTERTMGFCGSYGGTSIPNKTSANVTTNAISYGCTSCNPGITLDVNYSYWKDTTVKICRKNIVDSATNPYRWGILGNWRMEKAYTYYNVRKENDASITATNVRVEGTLKSFITFWTFTSKGITPKLDTTRWVWNSSLSNFNRKGAEIENFDPLGRYNSGLYGYNQSMPVAVAQNSKYRESLYDGFEDYGYKTTYCTTCDAQREFDFRKNNTGVDTTSAQSHTGLFSLKVDSGRDGKLTVPVVTKQTDTATIKIITGIDSTAVTGGIEVIGKGVGLKGSYYAPSRNSFGACIIPQVPTSTRTDTTVNFDWTSTPAILSNAGGCKNYQVKWSGNIQAKYNGLYYFTFQYAGTATVSVNNIVIINGQYSDDEPVSSRSSIYLSAGSIYPIAITYNKSSSDAGGLIKLGWRVTGNLGSDEVIPKRFLYLPTFTASDSVGSTVRTIKYYCVTANNVKPVNVIRPVFSPVQNTKVVASAWVRLNVVDCNATPALDSAIQIDFNTTGSQAVTRWLKKTGVRIEGWQRYEDTVTIPSAATAMYVHAKTASNYTIYVDDIRLQPFNSNLKGYVYNPYNLRLMADLDENNYATFYEYDDDGTLIRVKKETERGIMTIKETRSALFKDQ